MPERIYQLGFGEDLKPSPEDVTPEGFSGFEREPPGRLIREVSEVWQIDSPATAYEYLLEHVYHPIEEFLQEEMHALMLNTKNVIHHDALIYRGNDNQMFAKVKEIFYPAVLT